MNWPPQSPLPIRLRPPAAANHPPARSPPSSRGAYICPTEAFPSCSCRSASDRPVLRPAEVGAYQFARGLVVDVPEAGDLRLGAGDGEGAPQAVDALAVLKLAEARLAGRKDDQLRTREVEPGQVATAHDAPWAHVGAGQGEPGALERTLWVLALVGRGQRPLQRRALGGEGLRRRGRRASGGL